MNVAFIPIDLYLLIFVCTVQIVQGVIENKLHHYEVLKPSDIVLRGQKDLRLPILDSYNFIKFKAFLRTFEIDLEKSKVVSPSLQVVTVEGNGSEKTNLLQHTHYYTGRLTGDPLSRCTVSVDPSGILAHISTGDEEFVIEPAWRHGQKYWNSTDLMVYRKSDVKDISPNHTVDCDGSHDSRHTNISMMEQLIADWSSVRQRRSVNLGNQKVCKILLVADSYFHHGIGRGSLASTQNYMINLISQVNGIFQKTRWGEGATGLGLEIGKEFGKEYYRENSRFCLLHLLTHTPFEGKRGLAYVASSRPFDWGGICSSADTSQKEALNTGVSTFMDPEGNRQLSIVFMSTVAHEIGHNWGSSHDPDSDECSPSFTSGGKFLMFSKALKGVAKNNLKFSPCSTRAVYSVLSAKGAKCLTEPQEGIGVCGNGRIDTGEACDRGNLADKCCHSNCELAYNAVCSPVNFACCTEECQVASNKTECYLALDDHSDCMGKSYCNGINLSCPEPSLKTNTTCIDDGTCRNGVCIGFCENRGQLPCICSDASGDSCKRCCKITEDSPCTPFLGAGLLPDGQICLSGFCKQGKCVKTSLPAERLWKVIFQKITNSFDIFMKDNIVFFITLFSLIVYIPCAILVCRYDKKQENMKKKSDDVALGDQADRILKVSNRINVKEKHQKKIGETRTFQRYLFELYYMYMLYPC
uniref:ADAM 17-like protease isoform X2 n=1 Tax=Crassostrea virginica TaxID=6565 RepID=A0A8B8DKQ3_CRAVI|nr:ADAM 17-like protease isoform X2 [Crassostrea virginica]